MSEFKKVTHCRVCGSDRLREYLDLDEVPLANALADKAHQESKKYPLKVLLCGDCALSQLSVVVDPKILYTKYPYHSSVSKTFRDHCYELAKTLQGDFITKQYPLVVDIASNDGCLLKEFRRAGFKRFLGFEPAENLASEPYDMPSFMQGGLGEDFPIPVSRAFFSEETAKSVRGDQAGQGASFVIAQNILAHVDDLHDFLKGVHWILDDDGIFVVEAPYMYALIHQNQFDTIYHEHLSYFLLHPLKILFKEAGLPIFKVQMQSIHGGSIRIYASKGKYAEEKSVEQTLDFEEKERMYDFETYKNFGEKVIATKEETATCLELLYREGKKVMGYGASAKGISLLNYCKVPREHIHSIVDETPEKQGKFTPGAMVPIVDFEHFEKEKPDFMFLLAWNFADELRAKTPEHKKRGGHYIVPIPEFQLA